MKDIGKIIQHYIICRDGLKKLSDKFKADSAEYRQAMTNMENTILEQATEQGVDSFKTEYGTAFKSKTFKVAVEDWDMALKYIIKNDLTHMLTKSVAKAAAGEYMEQNNGQLPPGLKEKPWINLNVRRK